MDLKLTTATGKASTKSVEVSEGNFASDFNESLIHQVVTAYLAGGRSGTRGTKSRSAVSGGGIKPWRQKGTGRARHGSTKVNLWPGGGIVHGPTPRSYRKQMPRKMRRAAYRSALTVKAQDDHIVVLDQLEMDGPKTREMIALLQRLGVEGSALIMLPEQNDNVERSARNLPDVKTLRASYLNVRDLLGYDYLVVPQGSLEVIERILG